MRTLILLFLLIAGACSRSETSNSDKQSPAPQTEEAAKPPEETAARQPGEAPPNEEDQQVAEEADLEAPPAVELLDAGKLPHKALRTTFKTGVKQSLQVRSDGVLSALYGPLISTSSTMPTFVYQLEIEAKETTKESTQFAFRVTDVAAESNKEVQPAQVEAAKKAATSFRGTTGSFSINARGMVEAFSIGTPSDASLLAHDMIDQIGQAVRLASLPLPEEPVGKGAKWTATQLVKQRTARILQTTTFELLGVKGGKVRATSKYEAETPKQAIKMPGDPNGARFQLDELEFSGGGKGAWRLGQLGPSLASGKTVTVFKMMATAPKREVVVMAIETTLEVKALR